LIGRSRVVRNAVDVELGGIGAGGQKAQGGRSSQNLVKYIHMLQAFRELIFGQRLIDKYLTVQALNQLTAYPNNNIY
jgi:hypothetical protein